MDLSSPYKELKIGDTLDFHAIWDDELEGDTISTSVWTLPAELEAVADEVNTDGSKTIDSYVYRTSSVATAWLRVDPLADPQPSVGDVLEVVNTVTKVTDTNYSRATTLFIEIVDEYSW